MTKVEQVAQLVELGYLPHYCERTESYWPEDTGHSVPLDKMEIIFLDTAKVNNGLLRLAWLNIPSRGEIEFTDDEWEEIHRYCCQFPTLD